MRHLESSALCAVQPVSKPGYLFLGVCKDSCVQIGNVLNQCFINWGATTADSRRVHRAALLMQVSRGQLIMAEYA